MVLPYFSTDDIGPNQFDLILNQDSFPEINREAVLRYLAWIKEASRQLFYSINHESRPRYVSGDRNYGLDAKLIPPITEVGAGRCGYHLALRPFFFAAFFVAGGFPFFSIPRTASRQWPSIFSRSGSGPGVARFRLVLDPDLRMSSFT
jgi:hypothetical protein